MTIKNQGPGPNPNPLSFTEIEAEFGSGGGQRRLGKYRREFSIASLRSFSFNNIGLIGA